MRSLRVFSTVGFVVCSGLLLAGIGAARAAEDPGSEKAAELLPNGRAPLPRVVTGGQPSAEQLAGLAAAGFRTVVNLRADGEPSPVGEPEAAVEGLGMRYVHIPVAGAEGLDRENARALSEVLADEAAYPVAVYCGSGNRVGALLALEAAWIERAAPEEALELGLDAGLTRLEPQVRELLGLPPAAPPE